MTTLKLALFTLRQYAAYAQWHAGTEMFGGDERAARRAAHRELTVEGLAALRHRVRFPHGR